MHKGSEEVMHGFVYTKVPKPKRGRLLFLLVLNCRQLLYGLNVMLTE